MKAKEITGEITITTECSLIGSANVATKNAGYLLHLVGELVKEYDSPDYDRGRLTELRILCEDNVRAIEDALNITRKCLIQIEENL